MLLLQKVHATKAKTHHVRSHHVGEHIGEAEGRHLVVMTTSSSAELLQALKLGLSLCKIGAKGAAVLDCTDSSI